MKRQHQQTLQALFAHPLQHGLRCSRVEAMLLSLGAEVEHLSDHRLQVRLPAGQVVCLHAAPSLHHPWLDEEGVLRLRRLLQQAGITPGHPEPAPPGPRGDQAVRLVVRLDHHGASLWRFDGEEVEHAQLHPHGLWGGDQNLSHRHERDLPGQRAPLDHDYLERLSAAIADAEAVLLLGHGQGQADVRRLLVAHLRRHHPQLLARIAGVVTVDDSALSEAELLALAREHFGNLPHRRPVVVPGQEQHEPGPG
ncbi:MAG: hypothetical protein RLZZ137_630 [Cyanobacteriota bacterium]|jgi:hypothetical protein